MNTKKTAYYQIYDPSVFDASEYCVRQVAHLEDDIFEFGKDMIRLSKNLDSLDKQEIVAKIQALVDKHCGNYLEVNDSIANLDEYDGLETYEEDKDEDEDDFESYDENGELK